MTKHEVTGTEHDGLCEECDAVLTHENIVETSIGFYCSEECRDAAECGGETDFREDFHADG